MLGPFFRERWVLRFTGSVGVDLAWLNPCLPSVLLQSTPYRSIGRSPGGFIGVHYLNCFEGAMRHESGGSLPSSGLASSTRYRVGFE